MQIAASLERHLIPNLCSSPPDIEALRLYLILPECPLFKNPNIYITLTIPFAKAVICLSNAPLKVLGKNHALSSYLVGKETLLGNSYRNSLLFLPQAIGQIKVSLNVISFKQ